MRPSRRPRPHRKLKPSSAPAAGQGLALPFVAIVGRPNVGKSTLFNRLMGRRISIVEPTAGTTRDRVSALLDLPSGERVELCDMGGLGGTDDPLDKDVDRQISAAIELADAIVFVTDVRDGLIPMDQEIARRLLKLAKPVVLVANKAETKELEALAGELNRLGLGVPIPMSAREGTGRSDVIQALDRVFTPEEGEPGEEAAREAKEVRIAVVGRRNAGKSSYVNALFGAERVIVSDMPGTTRDAVDVRCLVDGEPVVLIDTAGLRKRGKADDAIELISHGRAREAIRRADVALVVFDVLRDISEVDKKIVELVVSENKPVVLVGNKWDLVKHGMSPEQYGDYVRKKIPTVSFAPVALISCTSKWNVKTPVELARELYQQSLVRVSTGELNRVIHEAFARRRPRKKRHIDAKIYFGTQIRTNPVTIVLFVNKPMLFDGEYQRYLSSELRAALPWAEIPIKLVIRERVGLIERGLTRAERDERKAARALEKAQSFMEDGAPPPSADVLAEFDRDEVREALAAELDAEEKAAGVKVASASLGGVKSSLATDALAELHELADANLGADDDAASAISLDDDEGPREGARPGRDELLYGEDADMVKRRRERFRARRGKGQSQGKGDGDEGGSKGGAPGGRGRGR